MAEAEPGRFVRIAAGDAPAAVHQMILQTVEPLFGLAR